MLNLYWYKSPNFGDHLSLYVTKKLSGQEVRYTEHPVPGETTYIVIGSILNFLHDNTNVQDCHVWGTGLAHGYERVDFNKPAKVYAVRGPDTAAVLRRKGIECPEVYGDPGLLLPMLHSPAIRKRYKLGIAPHVIDRKQPIVNELRKRSDVLVINLFDPTYKVIDEILSCECIISSSLHGIVAADAYNIPTCYVLFSDSVIGDGFKFRDYFRSIGMPPYNPLDLRNRTLPTKALCDATHSYVVNPKIMNDLLLACPFRKGV